MADDKIAPTKGPFTPEENEILKKAINEVCAQFDVEPREIVKMGDLRKDENKKYRGLWKSINDYLPHRTHSSVYRRVLRMLNPFKSGPWSKQEIDELQVLVGRFGSKWSKVQAELNRSAESCADKYREIRSEVDTGNSHKHPRQRLTWTEEDTELLRAMIRDELNMEPSDVTFKEIYARVQAENIKVPWTAIARKIGGDRTRLNCYERFLLMAGKKRRSKREREAEKNRQDSRYKKRGIAVPADDSAVVAAASASIDAESMEESAAAAVAATATMVEEQAPPLEHPSVAAAASPEKPSRSIEV